MKIMKLSFSKMFLTRYKYLIYFSVLATMRNNFDASALAHGYESRAMKQVKVGLVVDLKERWGRMGHRFIQMAISDFYNMHPNYKTRLALHVRDSQNDVLTSAAAVIDLIKNEQVIAIIGPETSQEALFDISLGEKSQIPIISFSASNPMLSSPYFIQATQEDSSQVEAISSIIHNFGWREVVPIYVDNQFGGGIIPYLVDALQQMNTQIPCRCVISSSAADKEIELELRKLIPNQTRVFVVHMNETLASRVFLLAKQLKMMSSDYVWIITSNIANVLSSLDHEVIQSMQGVLGVKTFVPKSRELKSFSFRWRRKLKAENFDLSNPPMSLYGLWAYDATFLLAEAVEQLGESSFSLTEVNGSSKSKSSSSLSPTIDFSTLGISNIGPELSQKLLHTRFQGISGHFKLVNGKLRTCSFDIINLNGTRENKVGFWTPEKGLDRKLGATRSAYSTSKDNLGIIWPGGDSNTVPKGWVIPTTGKKLRIGVPFTTGFTQFVKVSYDSSHRPHVAGFCKDLFEAVRKNLSYNLPVTYVPFSGSYDDLVYQVYLKKLDAAVGDITIIANRSNLVDFTLPYMESNVLMVVSAIKDDNANKTWAFLRPLSWKLWITSLCFFILIAFVIFVNEYQINHEFRRESWRDQIGLCLFFSFSTMVFSHKEVPQSNLSRVVMAFWVFTLLLLTQSYTASLASMLTAEKLQPAYKDVNELARTGKKVGVQHGTFIKGFLQRMHFNESNIVAYETMEELDDLLSKGSEGGGIAAAFDEAPYMKLFLATRCSQYMTVRPPISKTDGFAFVFPIGSPLVSDISRVILNITEGQTMTKIWNHWLKKSDDCPTDPSVAPVTSSNTLDLDSFVALFAITGGVSVAALIFKLVSFLHENRQVWRRNDLNTFKERLDELRRSFNVREGLICDSPSPRPSPNPSPSPEMIEMPTSLARQSHSVI